MLPQSILLTRAADGSLHRQKSSSDSVKRRSVSFDLPELADVQAVLSSTPDNGRTTEEFPTSWVEYAVLLPHQLSHHIVKSD